MIKNVVLIVLFLEMANASTMNVAVELTKLGDKLQKETVEKRLVSAITWAKQNGSFK